MRVELATAMGGEEAEEEKKAQIFDSLSLLEIHLTSFIIYRL